MRKTFLSLGTLFVCGSTVAVFVACSSGGSGGGGAGSVSSVDGSKTLGSLNDTEAKQYCQDAQNYQKSSLSTADMKKVTCGLTGRIFGGFGAETDAEAQSKCKTEFDKCMAKPDETPDAGAQEDACNDFKSRLGNCNATVSETNQCVADTAALYQQMANQDQCATAKAASPDAGASSEAFFEQPASCKALAEKCPSLFADSSDGG